MVTDAAGIPSQASCPPPSTQFFPPSVVKMGPLRAFNFLLTFLVFAAPLTLASAQDTPILEPPREARVTDGQSLHDNVLLIPLYAQLAENRIDGLLVLSKFWSRQQNSVSCATNYTVCQGTQVCCPDGNVCCSSEFLRVSFSKSLAERVTPFTNRRQGGTCCGAGYAFRFTTDPGITPSLNREQDLLCDRWWCPRLLQARPHLQSGNKSVHSCWSTAMPQRELLLS